MRKLFETCIVVGSGLILSTLMQGLGAYIMDIWSMFVFQICQERFGRDPKWLAAFHDEFILSVKDSEQSKKVWRDIIDGAIARTNKHCNLAVELSCDTQFGYNYSEIH
jgi:hypothetical protein